MQQVASICKSFHVNECKYTQFSIFIKKLYTYIAF